MISHSAQIILSEQRYESDTATGTKDWAIAQVIGRNGVKRQSFIDTNDQNNITFGLARTYFAKGNSGKSLDEIAQQATEMFNGDYSSDSITPEDVADLMLRYKNDPSRAERVENTTYQDAVNKFVQLTGMNPTKNLLSKLVGDNTDNTPLRESATAEYEKLSVEDQNNLVNQYNEYFNSLTLPQQIQEYGSKQPEENQSADNRRSNEGSNESKVRPTFRQGESDPNVDGEKGTQRIDYNIVPFKATKENSAQYQKAVQMFANNEPLEKIWGETGFFLRQNTKDKTWEWAYRIDQNKMEVSLPRLRLGSKYSLKDLVKYPEFFSLFPSAKNVDVRIVDDSSRESVMDLSVDGKTLTINLANYKGNERTEQKTKESIAEELQHYAQIFSEQGGGISQDRLREKTKEWLNTRRTDVDVRLRDSRLSTEQKNKLNTTLSNIDEALSYLNDNNNVSSETKNRVKLLQDRIYLSDIGEREGRLAGTDFKISPYESYNQDAEKLGIETIDFEAETKPLRSQTQEQISNQKYQRISVTAFNNLIERLKKSIPKTPLGKVNVLTDWDAFVEKAKSTNNPISIKFSINYKQLESQNKYTIPKILTNNIFLNNVNQPSDRRLFDKAFDNDISLPSKKINVSAIIPTQRAINIQNLKEVANVKSLPILLKEGDKYYVIDGHHRISDKILNENREVEALVYEPIIQFMHTAVVNCFQNVLSL